MNGLWYRQPANIWEEALPIGNGSIGGMIYGGSLKDVIALNKDTLWSGMPADSGSKKKHQNNKQEQLSKIRELILQENYAKARDLIEENILGPWGESYLPLGTLLIETGQTGDIADYKRELDLENGLASMSCTLDKSKMEREYFCSYPAKGMIIHTLMEKERDVVIKLSSKLRHTLDTDGKCLILEGVCPIHVEPDYMGDVPEAVVYGEGGIRCQIRVSVCCEEGTAKLCSDAIRLTGVRDYTVFLTVTDSFIDYKSKPQGKYGAQCEKLMEELCALSYTVHKEKHQVDYGKLFNSFHMELEGEPEKEQKYRNMPTDERLAAFLENQEDIGLFSLLVDYGRYLMISASREGSQPMNLQGIWNKNLRAVWSSNYTVNINTQMNYWPALPWGLSQLQEPLNEMLCDLSGAGSITADKLYGCGGWVSHHNIDLWRKTTPAGGSWKGREFSAVRHSMWPMSGAWLCRHLFEQYEYTLDKAFLDKTAFPVMRGSALFLLDWLVPMPDGKLGTVPSTSPENEFIYQGEIYGAGVSSAMDIFLCMELFCNCIKAIDILGVKDQLYDRLKNALDKLPSPQTGRDGRLLEWAFEYEEPEIHHRHVSHLYGLYPSDLMPQQFYEACAKSLKMRGDEGTGWSIAWKACLWARLENSARVYELLKRLLKPVDAMEVDYKNGGIYKNLFMAHPPFQIDANFGIAAAIMETFVQCRGGAIYLLAALPKEWKNGRVSGVAAKGALTLDMEWRDGLLYSLLVKKWAKGKTQEYSLYYQQKNCKFLMVAGEERMFTKDDFS